MRIDTLCILSITGMMRFRPGFRTATTRPAPAQTQVVTVTGLVVIFAIGVGQWTVLRRLTDRAVLWIMANALGRAVGLTGFGLIVMLPWHSAKSTATTVTIGVSGCLVLATAVAVTTGIFFTLIVSPAHRIMPTACSEAASFDEGIAGTPRSSPHADLQPASNLRKPTAVNLNPGLVEPLVDRVVRLGRPVLYVHHLERVPGCRWPADDSPTPGNAVGTADRRLPRPSTRSFRIGSGVSIGPAASGCWPPDRDHIGEQTV